jgi:hypothetical protein
MCVAASIVGSAAIGAIASNQAAKKQAQAGERAIAAQQGMFDVTQGNIRPFIDTGSQYAGLLSDLGKSGYATRQFGPEDLKAGLAPNYDFIKQQGLMAANNQASALGGVAGTGGQRGAIDYATNLAGNAYQNAFLNFNNQRNSIFGNLNSIAGLGSNAAQGLGNISANVGQNIGNNMTGIGNAQAGGIIGTANAITGAANNYLGYNFLSSPGQGGLANSGPNQAIPGYGAGSVQNAWKPAPEGTPSFIGPRGP